jgi:hypothetical protein
MNYQDTKQKVLSWCQELQKQGIISDTDLDNCRKSYNALGQGVDAGAYTEARTSKEYSFGMSAGQGESSMITDLTKRKYFKCTIATPGGDKYISVNPGGSDSNKLSLVKVDADGLDRANIIFAIQLANNGHYTIMNEGTGNYIDVTKDKQLLAGLATPGDGSHFKLTQSGIGKRTFTFEPVKYAGRFICEAEPGTNLLTIASTGNKYWVLDIISEPDTNSSANGTGSGSTLETVSMINNLLANINATRLEYYNILAQIEFLTLLRDKMYNTVKAQGDIMNYYFDKKDTRQLDISEDLLKYIQFSINNELRTHEGSQIDDMIKDLTVKAKDLELSEFNIANKRGTDLLELLRGQITQKKDQIASLNVMIEKINSQQRELNDKQTGLDKQIDKYDSRKDVVDVNYKFTQDKHAGYALEFKIIIATAVILMLLCGYFGYRLTRRFKAVILDS